jgi:hypothetical protein
MPAPDGGYTSLLDPGALDGARIGIWRDGSAAAGPASVAVLDAAIARLRACGAQVTDPVELPDYAKIGEPEFASLLHEFKVYLNAYLAAVPGEHPGTLAELIAWNTKHAATVQAVFGQELFEQSEATSGDLADPAYQAARADARRLATTALDSALVGAGLDAVVALSSSPAWLTDHILGDHHVFGTAGPPAVVALPVGDRAEPGGCPGCRSGSRSWARPGARPGCSRWPTRSSSRRARAWPGPAPGDAGRGDRLAVRGELELGLDQLAGQHVREPFPGVVPHLPVRNAVDRVPGRGELH